MFTAGEWPSMTHHGQMWQDTAKALVQRGVEIYSYGIKPGAQLEQLQSITFKAGNSYLIDGYMLPQPIPTGVTGEITYLLGIPFYHSRVQLDSFITPVPQHIKSIV